MPRRFPDDEGFDKVNFVIDSWTTGCDAPWYIYIETMKPAALKAFIVLLSFGYADVLRGRFRPKGLGRRTSKRKGRWNRRIPHFPELGNTIGKSLPFAEQIDDFILWKTKTKFLWRIDNAMQAGLFWWLVADVVEDFVFDWTSLLYESYWCQPDPPGRFSYRRSGFFVIPQYTWDKRGFGERDYQHAPPEWFFNSGATGPNPATVTAALRVQQRPGFAKPASLQVRIQNAITGKVYAVSDQEDTDENGDGSVPITGLVPAYTSFEVRARMLGAAWANVGNGVVMGVEVLP